MRIKTWNLKVGPRDKPLLPPLKCNLSKNIVIVLEMVLLSYHYFKSTYIFFLTFPYIFSFLYCHGDTELNPGPQKSKENALSICH